MKRKKKFGFAYVSTPARRYFATEPTIPYEILTLDGKELFFIVEGKVDEVESAAGEIPSLENVCQSLHLIYLKEVNLLAILPRLRIGYFSTIDIQ